MSRNDEPLFIASLGGASRITAEVAGSKATQLWQMARRGLNVPPAFVMPTTLCAGVNAGDRSALEALRHGLDEGIAWLEEKTGRSFGDARRPLLVSVRSGAAISMPGMLETILDVGLNDVTVHGLIRMSGNPRLAFDSFRRLVQGYGEVVDHLSRDDFERCLAEMVRSEGVQSEADLDSEALERLTTMFRELALRSVGHAIPQDPREQLREAALAVYRSWESAKAYEYRKLNKLDDLKGTAVTVQAMVFGNSGSQSGAGVAFSRNPATGAHELYVDFLFDAQGEDVVSGRRTPGHAERLAARLPAAAKQLADGISRIESEARDAQDVEFTIEDGRLYFLQTRAAKRSPRAALRIATDLVHEGLIDREEALSRIAHLDVQQLNVARFAEPAVPVATAISASPGVATGRIAFTSKRAKELVATGAPVILVRRDTSTEDVEGFAVAAGILTAVGGRTAHAAVVARQLGKICLVGCRALVIDEARGEAMIGEARVKDGDWLSLDGDLGEVTIGKRVILTQCPPEMAEIEQWRQSPSSVAGHKTSVGKSELDSVNPAA